MPKRSSKSPKSFSKTPHANTSGQTPFVRAFLKRVQNTVAKYRLWNKQTSFVVAVSGGPDSLCLLDALYLLSRKTGSTIHVVHVNYGLRGKDSELDEELVRERAKAYGVDVSVFHPKKTASSNLEEKLRVVRYQFLERVRKEKKSTLIAVAHHQDDQAETFLLRLLRGSGMRGLSSMLPKNGPIVRPLIETSRVDILRYLTERDLTYRTDKSNEQATFLRNRVRHELIPFLEKNYQANIKHILAGTASLLSADYQLFEERFSLPYTVSGNNTLFSANALNHLDDAILRGQLRLLLGPLYDKKVPPQGILDEFLKLIRSTKSKAQRLTFRGLNIERKGDTVTLLDFQP